MMKSGKKFKTHIEKDKKKEKAEEEEICHICFAEIPDSVLMPCCHGGICYKCAIDLWKTSDECHLCRGVKYFLKLLR